MLLLFILCSAATVFFGMRWFAAHSFEYLDGVKFSEQLDADFRRSILSLVLALAFGIAAFL